MSKSNHALEGFTPVGRPRTLTRELIADFRKILPQCIFLDSVGDFLGIHRSTWRKWLQRGRREVERMNRENSDKCLKSELLFVEFFDNHKKAIAEREISLNISITAAAKGGVWQAAAWALERCWPEKYGSQSREIRETQRLIDAYKEKVELLEEKIALLAQMRGASGKKSK